VSDKVLYAQEGTLLCLELPLHRPSSELAVYQTSKHKAQPPLAHPISSKIILATKKLMIFHGLLSVLLLNRLAIYFSLLEKAIAIKNHDNSKISPVLMAL
jgi:hypothetical protein